MSPIDSAAMEAQRPSPHVRVGTSSLKTLVLRTPGGEKSCCSSGDGDLILSPPVCGDGARDQKNARRPTSSKTPKRIARQHALLKNPRMLRLRNQ